MKRFFLPLLAVMALAACSTNPITGRKQLSLVSDEQINQEAAAQYKQFLAQNKVLHDANAAMVQRVGTRLANAIANYYRSQGKGSVLNGYNWEFNLVDNKEINAWCMPGGKVVVYSGLLPVTQNETALAIVLGHEITHAVAGHSKERMSQAGVAGLGAAILGAAVGNAGAQAGNVGGSLIILKNSRAQELEADHYGLDFAAMAGYDPREAIPFWQRMMKASEGSGQPPTFLSSHPADADRIAQIQKLMPEALRYYQGR